jgi:hypothetical protein
MYKGQNNELDRIQKGMVVDCCVALPSKFAAGNWERI